MMYSQVIMVLLHGYLQQLHEYLQWDPYSGDTYITSRDTYTSYMDTYSGTPIVGTPIVNIFWVTMWTPLKTGTSIYNRSPYSSIKVHLYLEIQEI